MGLQTRSTQFRVKLVVEFVYRFRTLLGKFDFLETEANRTKLPGFTLSPLYFSTTACSALSPCLPEIIFHPTFKSVAVSLNRNLVGFHDDGNLEKNPKARLRCRRRSTSKIIDSRIEITLIHLTARYSFDYLYSMLFVVADSISQDVRSFGIKFISANYFDVSE